MVHLLIIRDNSIALTSRWAFARNPQDTRVEIRHSVTQTSPAPCVVNSSRSIAVCGSNAWPTWPSRNQRVIMGLFSAIERLDASAKLNK